LQRRRTNRGFTLVELMVSMAVTLIVLGTALTVFKKSMDAATTVTAKAEMQANEHDHHGDHHFQQREAALAPPL